MSKLINRSNSDLCAIDLFINDVSLSSAQRLLLIYDIVSQWHESTVFDSGTHPTRRELSNRNHLGQPK